MGSLRYRRMSLSSLCRSHPRRADVPVAGGKAQTALSGLQVGGRGYSPPPLASLHGCSRLAAMPDCDQEDFPQAADLCYRMRPCRQRAWSGSGPPPGRRGGKPANDGTVRTSSLNRSCDANADRAVAGGSEPRGAGTEPWPRVHRNLARPRTWPSPGRAFAATGEARSRSRRS